MFWHYRRPPPPADVPSNPASTLATVAERSENPARDVADYLARFTRRCRVCKDVLVESSTKQDRCAVCRASARVA